MHPILLIAANYLREQRWLVLVLLAWVFGSSAVLGLDGSPVLDDVAFFLRQQSMYGVAFGAFLAASAIHNERRSRRVLSVLSKGIERRDYLAGLLCGVAGVEIIYAAAMALGGFWMLRSTTIPAAALGWLLLTVFLAAMLVAALAMLFSTFMNPLLALAATAITAALPAAMALAFAAITFAVVPVYPLLAYVMDGSLVSGRGPNTFLLAMAAAQVLIFWLAAAWIFGRRDIAAAVE